MMNFTGFAPADFEAFSIDGLEQRMFAVKQQIHPKLEQLGEYFAPFLSTLSGEEMFYHVAKHARRTVNPPMDTWVAFSQNKRGYKMAPHFEIGLWKTHMFVWFAILSEAPAKASYAKKMLEHLELIQALLPSTYLWCWDHTSPTAVWPRHSVDRDSLEDAFERLGNTKRGEVLCGITIKRDDPVLANPKETIVLFEETLKNLISIYRLM